MPLVENCADLRSGKVGVNKGVGAGWFDDLDTSAKDTVGSHFEMLGPNTVDDRLTVVPAGVMRRRQARAVSRFDPD